MIAPVAVPACVDKPSTVALTIDGELVAQFDSHVCVAIVVDPSHTVTGDAIPYGAIQLHGRRLAAEENWLKSAAWGG